MSDELEKVLQLYGVVRDGRLKIVLADGLAHDWIISDGDMAGIDWIAIRTEPYTPGPHFTKPLAR